MTQFSYKGEIISFFFTEDIIGASYNARPHHIDKGTITLVLKGGHTYTPGWKMDANVFAELLSDIAVHNDNTYDVWY